MNPDEGPNDRENPMTNETTDPPRNERLPGNSRVPGLLIVLAIVLASHAALADALVRQLSGSVEIGRGEPARWRAARVGDPIGPDERIRTGPDGRVEITTEAGTLRVHENSLLRLPSAEAEVDRVELESGGSLFDILRRAGRRFEVHTPTVVVSVKGTRFGVDTTSELGSVAVYRGMVGVREAGAEAAIETLVREGFLASGGAGLPIELDVSPSSDPWERWADFEHETGGRTEVPARLGDLDRAKASLLRATNADVLRNAAERRPEIAERLRRHRRDQTSKDASDSPTREHDGAPSLEPDPPNEPGRNADRAQPAASPDPDGGIPVRDLDRRLRHDPGEVMPLDAMPAHGRERVQQQVVDSARAREGLAFEDMVDLQAMTGGLPFPNGQPTLFFENLQGLPPGLLVVFVEALQDVQDLYAASGTAWTPGDVLLQLEAALVANGMTPQAANNLVNSLIGN